MVPLVALPSQQPLSVSLCVCVCVSVCHFLSTTTTPSHSLLPLTTTSSLTWFRILKRGGTGVTSFRNKNRALVPCGELEQQEGAHKLPLPSQNDFNYLQLRHDPAPRPQLKNPEISVAHYQGLAMLTKLI